jgi:hypothetical protein
MFFTMHLSSYNLNKKKLHGEGNMPLSLERSVDGLKGEEKNSRLRT